MRAVHSWRVPNPKSPHRPLPQPVAKNLAIALRAQREKNGQTQEDLAAAGHVSVQMIRRLEAGTANPTLGTLHALTKPLGTSLAALLQEAGA